MVGAALEPDGFNILNSCGPAAWQTIFHFHLHVVPRYEDDPLKLPWIPGAGEASEIAALADRIRESGPMSGSPVRLERDGAVAAMVLHDPPLNLFGAAAFEALNECLDEVEGSDARALVWRAEGEVFTGGADVNVFQQIVDAGGDRSDLSFEPLLGAVRRIEGLPIPTLALVHGLCLTAGLEVSLGCDMIWAGESAASAWSRP